MTKTIKQSIYEILENTDKQIMDLLDNLTEEQEKELEKLTLRTPSTKRFDAVHVFESRDRKISVCVLNY